MNEPDRDTNPLTVDPVQVVHETIDDEVIIIQLDRANYYSLAGSGREIWLMICAGLTPAAIVERLEAAYQGDNGDVAADFRQLLAQLSEEGLVQEGATGASATPSNGGPPIDASVPAGGTYAPPKLEKYTDMQDFLLIDPIHDVAAEGWPVVEPGK
jgi:hypothetical protein